MRRYPQEADENSDESDIDRSRLPRIMDDARRSKENGLPVLSIPAQIVGITVNSGRGRALAGDSGAFPANRGSGSEPIVAGSGA
jgi:hypothetical protein